MRDLIIGFSTNKDPKNVIAGSIRLIQGTEYSHVYVRTPESRYWNRSYIYQASGLKVNMMTNDVFLECNKVIKEFKISVPDDIYKEIVGFAMDQCGKSYGLMQLVGIAYVLGANCVTGGRHKNPWSKGFICSELVAVLLKMMDDDLHVSEFMKEKGLTYDTITPKDIEMLLERYFKD